MEIIEQKKFTIRLIKYALLAVSIIIAAIIIYSNLSLEQSIKSYSANEGQTLDHLKKSKSKHSLSINKSVFQGLAKDLSPYKIIAQQVNRITDSSFDLKTVNGNYSINNETLDINSLSGVFDNQTNNITLNGNVNINYQDFSFYSEKLSIKIENKEAHTDKPVTVKYKNSNIKSDSFKTENNSELIKFKGNVKSTFTIDDF